MDLVADEQDGTEEPFDRWLAAVTHGCIDQILTGNRAARALISGRYQVDHQTLSLNEPGYVALSCHDCGTPLASGKVLPDLVRAFDRRPPLDDLLLIVSRHEEHHSNEPVRRLGTR
jgi:hypothetical protein